MIYKLNDPKQNWQTSTVIFLLVIICALAVSLTLCMSAYLDHSPALACKDYQYDVHNNKVCLIPEEQLK